MPRVKKPKDPTQRYKKRTVHPNTLAALERSRIPFKKGKKGETTEIDPRINRKGVPRDKIALRALIQHLGGELVQIRTELQSRKNTGQGQRRTREQTIVLSRITDLLLRMYDSDNPLDHANILKAGWPGALSEDDGTKIKEFTLRLVYENQRPAAPEDLPLDAEEGTVLPTSDAKLDPPDKDQDETAPAEPNAET